METDDYSMMIWLNNLTFTTNLTHDFDFFRLNRFDFGEI